MPSNPPLSFLRRFLGGEAQFAFWEFVSKGVGAANFFLIVSALTLYEYGVFQLLLSLYAILSSFLSLGGGVVGNDVMRFIGEGNESKAKRLFAQYHGLRIAGILLIGLFLFFGSDLLSFKYSPEFLAFFKLLAILLFFEVFFSILKSLLTTRLQFALVASRSTLYKVVELAVIIFYLVFSSLSVQAVLVAMILGSAVSSLIILPPAWRAYDIWRSVSSAREGILLWVLRHHGKWEILQQFMAKLTSSLQPWLIKVFVGTEAVAIYAIAQTMVSTIIGSLPTKTLAILIPLEGAHPEKLQRLYHLGSKYLFLLSIALIFAASVAVPILINLMLGQYRPSLIYFYPLLLHVPITALAKVASAFLVVMRMQKYLFYQKVFKALTVLPMLFLIGFFGLWGLVAYQLGFAFLLFLSIYRFLRGVPPGFRIEWRGLLRFTEEDKKFLLRIKEEFRPFLKKYLPFFRV